MTPPLLRVIFVLKDTGQTFPFFAISDMCRFTLKLFSPIWGCFEFLLYQPPNKPGLLLFIDKLFSNRLLESVVFIFKMHKMKTLVGIFRNTLVNILA
jgi:hypothetical protein